MDKDAISDIRLIFFIYMLSLTVGVLGVLAGEIKTFKVVVTLGIVESISLMLVLFILWAIGYGKDGHGKEGCMVGER